MKCNKNVLNHCKMYNVGISLFCLPVLYMQRSFNFTMKNGEKNGIIYTCITNKTNGENVQINFSISNSMWLEQKRSQEKDFITI